MQMTAKNTIERRVEPKEKLMMTKGKKRKGEAFDPNNPDVPKPEKPRPPQRPQRVFSKLHSIQISTAAVSSINVKHQPSSCSLTCKSHSMGAERFVRGHSKD